MTLTLHVSYGYCSHHLHSLCECMWSDLDGDTGLRACSMSYRTRDWHKTKSMKFWSSPAKPGFPGYRGSASYGRVGGTTKRGRNRGFPHGQTPFIALHNLLQIMNTWTRPLRRPVENGAAALMWDARLGKAWSDRHHSLVAIA